MLRSFRGHTWESWEWDPDSKSPDAHLSRCRQDVYFHISPLLDSQGTAGVRGTKGETSAVLVHKSKRLKYNVTFHQADTVLGV